MPFSSLSGGELFDRVASDDYKMTEAEAINYIRQVCDGIKHCHEHNIVHLDIKVIHFSNNYNHRACTSKYTFIR